MILNETFHDGIMLAGICLAVFSTFAVSADKDYLFLLIITGVLTFILAGLSAVMIVNGFVKYMRN